MCTDARRWTGNYWLPTKDGNPIAASMYRRHYSCYQYADGRRDNPLYRNRNLICGPGQKMVLITLDYRALWVWRKFIDASGQTGINCAVFRNESDILSSNLILDAKVCAWNRWPGERLYTYVDASAVRSSNPGYCFKVAGWKQRGKTKSRELVILEKLPVTEYE